MQASNPKEKLIVGVKQSTRAISEGNAQIIFIAKDAEQHITGRLLELANSSNVEIVYFESMKELGKYCKIDVGAATAVLIK